MTAKNSEKPSTQPRSAPAWANHKVAINLWDAFLRLQAGTPQRVPVSAKIIQSTVAAEAGYHRSILTRSGYPQLYQMIHDHGQRQKKVTTTRERLQKKRDRIHRMQAEYDQLEARYDTLLSKYNSLVSDYIARLGGESGNVTPIR